MIDVVKFPGLGITLDVPKIAFSIFGVNVRWYAVCIVLGIVVALVLSKISKEKFYIDFDQLLEIMIITLLFGVIGARIYYVIFNFSYYLENPLEIINIKNGGLAIYGGIIAGAIVIIKMCEKYGINKLDFFDYIVPFVSIAQAIGRWGNFFNIEAFGTETTSIFRMGINTAQGYIEVHPTFLYECVACVCIYFILRKMQKNRKFAGEICFSYLALYSLVRFFIEGLRQDSLMFIDIKVSQLVSAIIFIYSCYYLLKGLIKSRNR